MLFVSERTAPGLGGALLQVIPFPLLMLLGLALGTHAAAIACIATGATVFLSLGVEKSLVFTCIIAYPVYYFVQQALLWRGNAKARDWYPMLRVLSEVTIIAACYLMFLAMLTESSGSLRGHISSDTVTRLREGIPGFASASDDGIAMVYTVLLTWGWILVIYASATFANGILRMKNRTLRPSLAVEKHGLPGALLFLLLVCGGLAVFGKGMDRYTAETLFLLLLLPYMLCGLTFVHAYSLQHYIPLRRLWIACVYVAILYFYWLALGAVALGLYQQLSEILDRHKKIG